MYNTPNAVGAGAAIPAGNQSAQQRQTVIGALNTTLSDLIQRFALNTERTESLGNRILGPQPCDPTAGKSESGPRCALDTSNELLETLRVIADRQQTAIARLEHLA